MAHQRHASPALPVLSLLAGSFLLLLLYSVSGAPVYCTTRYRTSALCLVSHLLYQVPRAWCMTRISSILAWTSTIIVSGYNRVVLVVYTYVVYCCHTCDIPAPVPGYFFHGIPYPGHCATGVQNNLSKFLVRGTIVVQNWNLQKFPRVCTLPVQNTTALAEVPGTYIRCGDLTELTEVPASVWKSYGTHRSSGYVRYIW